VRARAAWHPVSSFRPSRSPTQRTSASGAAQAWDGFYAAWTHRNVVELEDLAEQNPSQRVGEWAALEAGKSKTDKP
jgi:hypothetical protein